MEEHANWILDRFIFNKFQISTNDWNAVEVSNEGYIKHAFGHTSNLVMEQARREKPLPIN
jgi:hypothetical protein